MSSLIHSDGRVGVATESTALLFDAATGAIVDFRDVRSGRNFAVARAEAPLFTLELARLPGHERFAVDSADFKHIEAAADEETDGLVLRFADHPDWGGRVEVYARTDDDGSIRLRAAVLPGPGPVVASLIFPRIAQPPTFPGSSSEDGLLIPWDGGALLPEPGRLTQTRAAQYPGLVHSQFYARTASDAGAYVAMNDTAGHCRRFVLRTEAGDHVRVDIEHRFPEVPADRVELPYEFVLRTFQGDWRDAADIYKAWAGQQAWCAKRLIDRDDVPAFLKDGAAILIDPIRRREPEQDLADYLHDVPDLLDAYRQRGGLKHIVYVPYGWENRGTWAGPRYFPAYPDDDAWRAVNRTLRERGHRTAFLTSGYWWVVKRRATVCGPAFDDSADFDAHRDLCAANPDGTPWMVDYYDRTSGGCHWKGLSAALCHGATDAAAILKRIFLQAQERGAVLVSFDQEQGGQQSAPCYHPTHGHPPGWGAWMWQSLRDLCTDILRAGRAREPDFALLMENLNELAIPWMATFWSRQFAPVHYGGRGTRSVGLFSYLYHEYVTLIGAACVQGQGDLSALPDPGLRCMALANNLVLGLIPGPLVDHVPLEPDDTWTEMVSRAFFAFCRPYAVYPEYLLLGRMRRPPMIECEDVDRWYWVVDHEHGTPQAPDGPPLRREGVSLPSVRVGAFEAPDGKTTAVFVVNATDAPRAVAVAMPADSLVSVRGTDGAPVAEPAHERDGHGLRFTLAPFEVRVLLAGCRPLGLRPSPKAACS